VPIFPTYTGQTDPPWSITCNARASDGTLTLVNLTGYTVKVRIAPAPATGDPAFVDGGGAIDASGFALGVVKYTPNGSEFASSGTYIVQVRATNGSAIKEFDYIYGPVYKGS
jgi:hypothetical protein